MSTTGRTAPDGPTASDVAAALRDAPFVHVVAAANGDALAGAGLLARACEASGIPFQVSIVRTDEGVAERLTGRDDATVPIVVGTEAPGTVEADVCLGSAAAPASVAAYEVAEALGATVDPTLALVGAIAAECEPGAYGTDRILERATEDELLERRPGVVIPTEDLADGLAHSTLYHARFSGNVGAAQAELAELELPAELDADAHRRVASMVALEATGGEDVTPRAAEAIQRALHPYATPDGTFATLGGYADVLEAVARERPGAGVALALGHGNRDEALDSWREHAEAAHAALRTATTGRYDGTFVARIDEGPVETVARLLAEFRSPEPIALVVHEDEAAAVATDESDGADVGDVAAAMRAAVETVGGDAGGSRRTGYARYDGEETAFIEAFREAL